jgi:hypothetical protein
VNEHVLGPQKLRVIQVQSRVVRAGHFFLAGGAGLGLRLGHRLSDDLDWFTPREFDANKLTTRLAALHEKPTTTEQQGPHTVRAYYGTLETSFIRYAQVAAKPDLMTVGRVRIPVADIETLAAMKAAALHDRGAKRDFIDIHAICNLPGWSVARFIDQATKWLPLEPVQLKLALTYFVDADQHPMPNGCTMSWAQVKVDLVRDVRAWERNLARGPER